jgi:hypothetical protein
MKVANHEQLTAMVSLLSDNLAAVMDTQVTLAELVMPTIPYLDEMQKAKLLHAVQEGRVLAASLREGARMLE